jgi:hypothetical protein
MEVGGKGAVEGFEFGQVYLDTVVDGVLEVLVGKTTESWQCSANHICVVAMIGARAHVAKYPGVVTSVFVVCRALEVSVGDRSAFVMEYVSYESERPVSFATAVEV